MILKILIISSDNSEDIKTTVQRVRNAFENCMDSDKLEIDYITACEKAFHKIKLSASRYDVFIVNTATPNCYGYSLIEYINGVVKFNEKIKLLISDYDTGIQGRNFISLTNDILYVPDDNIIRIRTTHFRDPGFFKKIINTFITDRPRLYISYGNDIDNKTRDLIKELIKYSQVTLPNINIICDFNSLKFGESLEQFVKDMGDGDAIILIMNDKYFTTEYCMLELRTVLDKAKDKIYPISSGLGRKFLSADGYSDSLSFWMKRVADLEDKQRKMQNNNFKRDLKTDDDINLFRMVIERLLPELRGCAANFFSHPFEDLAESKFLDIFELISTRLDNKKYIEFYQSKKIMEFELNKFYEKK